MTQFRIAPDRNVSPGWRIGALGDIPIFVEPSFFFLVAILFFLNYREGNAVEIGLFIFVLFFSVLLHEIGHALASKYFRLHSIRIALNQWGGYTAHSASTTRESLAIIAAGPAVTFLLAGIGYLLLAKAPGLQEVGPPDAMGFVLGNLVFLNLFLGVYNMLPIFPMDGGQILMNLLALRLHPERALVVTARVSIVAAVLTAILCFKLGLTLALFFLIGNLMTNIQILQSVRR